MNYFTFDDKIFEISAHESPEQATNFIKTLLQRSAPRPD